MPDDDLGVGIVAKPALGGNHELLAVLVLL